MTAPPATSLSALVDAFDIFFVDQYGVLHHGQKPYDGAAAALKRIKALGKRVVLLSNSGKRARLNGERLGALGFPPESWDVVVSAGEVAWRMLSSGQLTVPRASERPLRCLLLERGDDGSSVDGLGYEIVDNGADADLVIIAGSDGDRMMLAEYEQRIAPAAARKIPALCTNPDKAMVTASGPCFGPGLIAELYEALGGHVTWIGKPFPDMYRVAMEDIGAAPGDRILCIGDSIENDIAGALRAGLSSALVVGTGILAETSEAERADLYARHGATPDFTIPAFTLG